MTVYNKLVRDRIPEIIQCSGAAAEVTVVRGVDLLEMLFSKLREECHELSTDQNAEEIADVLEVLMACSKAMGISWSDVEILRQHKRNERGGFEKGIILRTVGES